MRMRLRALEDDNFDQLFEWQRDPGAVAMAAFTRSNPSDRAAFDGHYQRIRHDPDYHQGVTGAAGSECFAESGAARGWCRSAVVDADPLGLNTEVEQGVMLSGEVLVIGGASGVPDKQRAHGAPPREGRLERQFSATGDGALPFLAT